MNQSLSYLENYLFSEDTKYFISFCNQNNFIVEQLIDIENRYLTNLFILSQSMMGDIIIVIQLIKGISTGSIWPRNILFNIAIENCKSEKIYN